MSSATLSIIGLYNYDHSLFDKMELPEGIDKGLTIDSIIMRGGDYEVLYPDPNLLKDLIGSWSKQWFNVFYNWQRATKDMDDIKPLDNYDRHESWSDTGSNHSTSSDNITGSGSTTGSDSSHGSASVTNDTTNNATNTNKISADDSNNFVNRTQDTSNNTQNNTQSNTTDTTANTSTQSTSNTQTNTQSDGTNSSTHEGHIFGNIGVTTSAAMYAEFHDIMRKYGNIYDCIATVFCQQFVIPIL